MIREFLESHDCRILEAEDGARAFELAKKEAPDLVILDMEMPNVRGSEAAWAMREDSTTAGIPIIIFTGNDETTVRQEVALGADLRYVGKSDGFLVLWETVEKLLPAEP